MKFKTYRIEFKCVWNCVQLHDERKSLQNPNVKHLFSAETALVLKVLYSLDCKNTCVLTHHNSFAVCCPSGRDVFACCKCFMSPRASLWQEPIIECLPLRDEVLLSKQLAGGSFFLLQKSLFFYPQIYKERNYIIQLRKSRR